MNNKSIFVPVSEKPNHTQLTGLAYISLSSIWLHFKYMEQHIQKENLNAMRGSYLE